MGTRFAAIDVGSNAIRLVIGERTRQGELKILKKVREPLRLGKDVFKSGTLNDRTRGKIVQTFRRFKNVLENNDVEHVRAVATSALREAKDRAAIIREVEKASGIEIEVIDGLEEGRLIYSAVSHRLDLREKVSLLIDIGGGSVELTVVDHSRPRASKSFQLGTLRILQILEEKGLREDALPQLIRSLLEPVKSFLSQAFKGLDVDQAIGTGGNFECLGKLRVALLQKSSMFSMTHVELDELVNHLGSMTIKERVQFLRLREDRADVVMPAAFVTSEIMTLAKTDVLTIPYVGLRDGILADLSEKVSLRAAR